MRRTPEASPQNAKTTFWETAGQPEDELYEGSIHEEDDSTKKRDHEGLEIWDKPEFMGQSPAI